VNSAEAAVDAALAGLGVTRASGERPTTAQRRRLVAPFSGY
jgi:hypothetical protein